MSGLLPGVSAIAAADGARLEYEIVGDGGEPVVLLHGSFTGRSAFDRQRDALTAAGFQLVLLSMRGHDGSTPGLPADHGFASTEADDVLVVLGQLGLTRARFVGHSTGGTVAFALARAHPELVASLVLIEPTLVGLLEGAWADQIGAAMGRAVAAGTRNNGRDAMAATLDFIGGAGWDRLDAVGRDRVLDRLAPLSPLAATHIGGLHRFAMTAGEVVELRPPSLWLYGRDSVPFEAEIAARVAALRPDLPVRFIDGAGHNTHRDAPGPVNDAIVEFFAAGTPK